MHVSYEPIHGDRRNESRETRTVDYYCRHHGWVTVEQVPLQFAHRDCIPVIDTTDDAKTLLQQLRARHEHAWVSVFWDRGWGDAGTVTEISIIADGDGQWPYAYLTPDAYSLLLASGVIRPNSLRTYKARKLHDYEPPPPKPRDPEVTCPGDPTHYAHSHDPGGAWYGVPLDHGKNGEFVAEPGGCAACGYVHEADEPHLMEAPR